MNVCNEIELPGGPWVINFSEPEDLVIDIDVNHEHVPWRHDAGFEIAVIFGNRKMPHFWDEAAMQWNIKYDKFYEAIYSLGLNDDQIYWRTDAKHTRLCLPGGHVTEVRFAPVCFMKDRNTFMLLKLAM